VKTRKRRKRRRRTRTEKKETFKETKLLARICAITRCEHVGEEDYMPKRCPCKLVCYCSKACQLATWEEHKHEHRQACKNSSEENFA
jgi:hypothetical protein